MQLIFKEDMTLMIRAEKVNYKLKGLRKPTTIKELETVISTVDGYAMCPGGPPSSHYQSVISSCCYKDGDYWRHKKCSQIVDKEVKVCIPCRSIHSRLSQVIMRDSLRLKKSIRLDVNMTELLSPKRFKNVIDAVRKRNKSQRKRIYHRDKIICGLKEKLDKRLKELQQVKEEDLNAKLKKAIEDDKIEEAQVLLSCYGV